MIDIRIAIRDRQRRRFSYAESFLRRTARVDGWEGTKLLSNEICGAEGIKQRKLDKDLFPGRSLWNRILSHHHVARAEAIDEPAGKVIEHVAVELAVVPASGVQLALTPAAVSGSIASVTTVPRGT